MSEETKPTEEIKPAMGPIERPIQVVSGSRKGVRFNKPLFKTISMIVLAIILIGGAGIGAYMWRDNAAKDSEQKLNTQITSLQKSKNDLEQLLADEIAKNALLNKTSDNKTCVAIAPSESVIDNIKSSITSGNTAALEGYMATSVNVTLAASGGVGASTATQAVAAITDFISSNNSTWAYNFSLEDAVLTTYRNGSYGKYFSTISVVGKNTEKKVISFSFDCNGKINSVFMSASEDLLI